jgi:hypothetical protein
VAPSRWSGADMWAGAVIAVVGIILFAATAPAQPAAASYGIRRRRRRMRGGEGRCPITGTDIVPMRNSTVSPNERTLASITRPNLTLHSRRHVTANGVRSRSIARPLHVRQLPALEILEQQRQRAADYVLTQIQSRIVASQEIVSRTFSRVARDLECPPHLVRRRRSSRQGSYRP